MHNIFDNADVKTWADGRLREYGYTFDGVMRMKEGQRAKVLRKLMIAARSEEKEKELLLKELADTDELPGAKERTELHRELRAWADGPLKLEHPQGSSFHHMLEYDVVIGGNFVKSTPPDLQIFVVERDWARAFAGYDLSEGECPMPFPHCLFEFRISGVRVLAFFDDQRMVCIYGRGGVWVADDFSYLRDGTHIQRRTLSVHNKWEFPRVNKMVLENVRVACIMVDANVAQAVAREASSTLVAQRTRAGRQPPRNHYAVDLKRRVRYGAAARGQNVGTRAPQRGHFRRGTWVHYQDADSGQVPYADSGGFWHSRTWRSWHFAGDPDNIIEKEYKL